MQQYFAYTDELQESGKLVSTAPLQPTATSQSVRVRDGRTSLTDPYAETKEQLGGYFLADCKDLDQAIELAQRVPVATTGSVEIRPIAE